MPYIKQVDRADSTPHTNDPINTVGELNYAITMLCQQYLNNTISYQRINDVVGALECCKIEFYRRLAAPYEDEKIKENGDVY